MITFLMLTVFSSFDSFKLSLILKKNIKNFQKKFLKFNMM